jgi:hypothetical protein
MDCERGLSFVGDNDEVNESEGSPIEPDRAATPASPFARPPGFEGNVGHEPPPAPTAQFPAYGAPSGEPVEPWQPAWQTAQQPGFAAWPAQPPASDFAYGQVPPPPARKPWLLIGVLVVALVAGGTALGLVGTDSTSSTPTAVPSLPIPLRSLSPNGSPAPNPGAAPNSPATPGNPANPANPAIPLPNVGLFTPPALLAIGYHVYSSRLRDAGEVAIDAAEEVQFKKDGLERIVGLRALTIGKPGDTSDDYDADISVLRFKDAAGAEAELNYSNKRNQADSGAQTIALPGLPQVTAFLNKDASGPSIGAFATVGRYQVVLILGGLSPNAPADRAVLAAEAARVMKALLLAASTIEPAESAASPGPLSPSESPSVAPSESPSVDPPVDPPAAPTATPSGIHA